MKFYQFHIFLGDDLIGEDITPMDDPKAVAIDWLSKAPEFIRAGILRTMKDEPGLLVAEKVK